MPTEVYTVPLDSDFVLHKVLKVMLGKKSYGFYRLFLVEERNWMKLFEEEEE